jgi:formamidopyrimidine-DNA glycosylase
MPELPEVETLRRELTKAIVGKTIKSASCDWFKMVKPLSVSEFQSKIKNKKIVGIQRRSKVLIFDLAGPLSLLIHLKLTGQLIFRPYKLKADGYGLVIGGHPQKGGFKNLPNKFTHLIIDFTDGSILYFNDLRKFGWARLVDDAGVAEMIGKHGPEPLTKEFNLAYFQSVLKKYPNRKIKQILLDQKLIGGLGNIYCDEACYCAKILPVRIVRKIKPAEAKKLFVCINRIIKLAISKKGTSADTYVQLDGRPGGMMPYLKVYGRKGEKCGRCGGIVERMKLNGRGTHFCRHCQK